MPDVSEAYPLVFFLDSEEVPRVSYWLESHDEYSGLVKMIVNSDRGTFSPLLGERCTDGRVLVTVWVPREGVDLPRFNKEFCEARFQELPVVSQGERKR